MRNNYKRIVMLALVGVLLGTTPAPYVSATETTIVEDAEISEITENTANNTESIDDTETPETEVSTENETIKDNTKKDPKTTTKKEKVNYKVQILTITKDKFVADSLDGVDALYRKGSGDGSSTTYSCAAYIKRYYKDVHGVTVTNLLAGRTPVSSEGNFKSVKDPQVGDVVACRSTSGSNHWAIVKQVNDDNTVTLIEQNWKWSQGGQTLCKINRSISISSATFYRLYK